MNINAHPSSAFTSAFPAISSSHTSRQPEEAAQQRGDSRSLEQEVRSKIQKQNSTQHSVANFEHKCAPVLCIYVSFACNQQLAHCRVTIRGSPMQSGATVTRTENQKQNSKTHQNTKIGFFERKRAPVLCIHVSFACNQQLAHFQATTLGSVMQSGFLVTRTENQKQTSKTN